MLGPPPIRGVEEEDGKDGMRYSACWPPMTCAAKLVGKGGEELR